MDDFYLMLFAILLKYSSFPPGKAWARTEGGLVRSLAMYICNLHQRCGKSRLGQLI